METFSVLLVLCAGYSPVTGEFPSQSQWRGALKFSLICAWTNNWVNNRDAGDLRRHCAHYDANVMDLCSLVQMYQKGYLNSSLTDINCKQYHIYERNRRGRKCCWLPTKTLGRSGSFPRGYRIIHASLLHDYRWLWLTSHWFTVATKQFFECLSVRLPYLFDNVPVIILSWNFQEWLLLTQAMSMQKVKVGGQKSRSQRSTPNSIVSGP